MKIPRYKSIWFSFFLNTVLQCERFTAYMKYLNLYFMKLANTTICGKINRMYSTVFKSQFTYLPRQRSGERVRLGIRRLLVRAQGAPLFFFVQCSPVGITIFTGEDSQSEWMKRDEWNRVYWFQTRFLSLVYL